MAKTGNQFYATFCANILALTCGLGAGWTSAAIPLLKSSESPLKSGRISDEQASLIGSSLALGGVFGSIVFGYIASLIGRKRAIFFIAFPQILGWTLNLLAEGPELLMAFRFLIGFSGSAVFNLVAGYTTEISSVKLVSMTKTFFFRLIKFPFRVRGLLGSTLKLFFGFGILFSYIFGAVLPHKLIPLASVSFSIIFLFCFWYIPETPIHLLRTGNYDVSANTILSRLSFDPLILGGEECFKLLSLRLS